MLEYFTYKKLKGRKGKMEQAVQTPVLNEEDEQFLERITSEGTPPPLPERPTVILDNGKELKGRDAQIALMDGADAIPLPTSPPLEPAEANAEQKDKNDGEAEKKTNKFWSYVTTIPGRSKVGCQKVAAHPVECVMVVLRLTSGRARTKRKLQKTYRPPPTRPSPAKMHRFSPTSTSRVATRRKTKRI